MPDQKKENWRERKARRPVEGFNRIDSRRTGWIKAHNIELIRYEGEPDDPTAPALHVTIKVAQKYVTWFVEQLTMEELTAIRLWVNDLFDRAEKVCTRLDKEAQDALDNGDDSHSRIFRAPPHVVDRPRRQRAHGEGVQQRPASMDGGLPDGARPGADGDGAAGDELAQHGPEGLEAQDDAEA